jgi:site-specific DNA-methyltransferase (adenine-specific)
MSVRILSGDCRAILPTLDADSFCACVTDPPYHLTSMVRRLSTTTATEVEKNFTKTIAGQGANPHAAIARGFMGKTWDGGDVALRPETWAAVLRVLKPGAHLLAFGGTRTYHRLACAIEDAGFEIRDAIMWHYGSGFPKSHDVSKAIDKAAGAEREVRSKGKPVKRMIPGADQDATGSWVKNNGREFVPTITAPATDAARQWQGWGTALKPATEIIVVARKPLAASTIAANVLAHGTGALNIDGCRVAAARGDEPLMWKTPRGGIWTTDSQAQAQAQAQALGRWPANVIHDGSDEVLAAFPELHGAGSVREEPGAGTYQGSDKGDWGNIGIGKKGFRIGDSGSAARFFKSCPYNEDEWNEPKRFHYTSKADRQDRLGSKHPTVKPVDLMRYLVRLVTPPGGRVLDPFGGSGTTAMACMADGFDATLIEMEAEYVADIRRRIAHVSGGDAPLFASVD